MNIIEELQKIYDSEINIEISWFWDGGVDVKIGDCSNGYKWKSNYDTVEEGIRELIKKVKEIYPDSDYAKGIPVGRCCENCYHSTVIKELSKDTCKECKDFSNFKWKKPVKEKADK